MFACQNLTTHVGKKKIKILDDAFAQFPKGQLHAVIGPSGCGKTTLMKSMLGILSSEGKITYDETHIEDTEKLIGLVGLTPQFSIAFDKLNVFECIDYALQLYVADKETRTTRLDKILGITGLAEHKEKKVSSLSGGQLRRLGLGLELTYDPPYLVCDEVTSGLDPRSEDHILGVMRKLQEESNKTFICIIHNLAKLNQFDTVTVVFHGVVIFQGSLDWLIEYFQIPDALHLYDQLNTQDVEFWRGHWERCRSQVQKEVTTLAEGELPKTNYPSALGQMVTLLERRFLLFFRDTAYLGLTLAITFGFPILVVIFAFDGLPQLKGMAMDGGAGILETLRENIRYQKDSLQLASLVNGLIMFQVILLSLMGANNGAREIAGERTVFEKERLSGLSAFSFATSKIIFISIIAILQGLWMTFFVKIICHFPGGWLDQMLTLSASCLTMSLICLGFSALLESGEKANILSIYLVGFQLPLSGVVLALPAALVWVCRPFITTFWGWAGYMSSMKDSRLYDAFQMTSASWLPGTLESTLVISLQMFVGIFMVYWGCYNRQGKL